MVSAIHAHPVFKLGAGLSPDDPRTLKFSAILREKFKLPADYDFDAEHKGLPPRMYGNDTYGDCVIAGRANQQARMELLETGKILTITDKEVEKEYFRETGGPDSGLDILQSLKSWKKDGWTAGGRRLFIQGYASVNRKDHEEVKHACFLDCGLQFGLALPETAADQIDRGKVWDYVGGKGSTPGSWGGHDTFDGAWTTDGPAVWTWAQKQQMTWRFFDKYCTNCYLVLDAHDSDKRKRLIDKRELMGYLAKVA